jgi:hypothetical protein
VPAKAWLGPPPAPDGSSGSAGASGGAGPSGRQASGAGPPASGGGASTSGAEMAAGASIAIARPAGRADEAGEPSKGKPGEEHARLSTASIHVHDHRIVVVPCPTTGARAALQKRLRHEMKPRRPLAFTFTAGSPRARTAPPPRLPARHHLFARSSSAIVRPFISPQQAPLSAGGSLRSARCCRGPSGWRSSWRAASRDPPARTARYQTSARSTLTWVLLLLLFLLPVTRSLKVWAAAGSVGLDQTSWLPAALAL